MLSTLKISSRCLSAREVGCLRYRSRECIRRVQQFSFHHATLSEIPSSDPTELSTTDHTVQETLRKMRRFFREVEYTSNTATDQHDDSDDLLVAFESTFKNRSSRREGEGSTNTEIWHLLQQRISDVEALMPCRHPDSDEATPSFGERMRSFLDPIQVRLDRLRRALVFIQSGSLQAPVGNALYNMPASDLLSDAEWCQLFQTCLDSGDVGSAEIVLGLMKLAGVSPSDEQRDAVLNAFAIRGMIKEADAHVAGLTRDVLRERQLDLLVKARVAAQKPDEARELLESFEKVNVTAPIRSYTRVIEALFKRGETSQEENITQAFQLFTHMRDYHVPDDFLYELMIRSAPRHSFHVFKEMVAHGVIPTAKIYNLVIEQCLAIKGFAQQAVSIAREMLDAHRNRSDHFPEPLLLTQPAFSALMADARRCRNLYIARWFFDRVLQAQSIRSAQDATELPAYVNTNVLTNLFITYSTFRPRRRQGIREASSQPFGDLPQSSEEVIREVTLLWKRIITDVEHAGKDLSESPPLFSHAILTPNLLNAYMSVHYAHSLPSQAYKVNADLFESLGITRDAFTRMMALEAYAAPGKHIPQNERLDALNFCQEVWKDWLAYEDLGLETLYDRHNVATPQRKVERAWGAMIRLFTYVGELNEAEGLLHLFVWRYPPPIIGEPLKAASKDLNEPQPKRPTVPGHCVVPFFTTKDIGLLLDYARSANRERTVRSIEYLLRASSRTLGRMKVGSLEGDNDKENSMMTREVLTATLPHEGSTFHRSLAT